VAVRTLHVTAMGVLLGGIAFKVPVVKLCLPIALTVLSGSALLFLDLWKSCAFLCQGAGVAVLLKLTLLGLGHVFPSALFHFYLVGTVIASIGSHMSSTWRHFSVFRGRVLNAKDET
jgi:hypothetical protein